MELEGKTIGITGIGGFVGLQMGKRALKLGIKVKGMEISPAAAEFATQELKKGITTAADSNLSVEIMVGNVTDMPSAIRLCQDCAIIFHTAAIVTELSTMEESRRVNVMGTVTMAEAAKSCGIKHFIHLSSVMVYGFTFRPYVTEDGEKRGEGDPYCQTKIESEIALMKYHQQNGMNVTIIRPGDIIGPRSVPWVLRPISLAKTGRFFLVDGGKGCMNHVHVDNLLDAVFLCLQNPAARGEAFNVTDGCSTTWMEYFTLLFKVAKLPKPRALPFWLLYILIRVMELIYWLLRWHNPAGSAGIYFISRPYPYSIEKAKRVLGYQPKITLNQAIEEIAESLKEKF